MGERGYLLHVAMGHLLSIRIARRRSPSSAEPAEERTRSMSARTWPQASAECAADISERRATLPNLAVDYQQDAAAQRCLPRSLARSYGHEAGPVEVMIAPVMCAAPRQQPETTPPCEVAFATSVIESDPEMVTRAATSKPPLTPGACMPIISHVWSSSRHADNDTEYLVRVTGQLMLGEGLPRYIC